MYQFLVKVRSAVLVFLTHHMALPLLKLVRKNEVFPYTREDLCFFPPDTLGKHLVDFLDVNNLQLLPYYARHDIKHILLGYETTDEGEGSLQCFMLGNGHLSFPVVATVVYCFLTMPEHWHLFRKAYRRGKEANNISEWKWFEILKEPTISLQQKIDQTNQHFT
jgi:ubiquinone biosynthesis protein Coq4